MNIFESVTFAGVNIVFPISLFSNKFILTQEVVVKDDNCKIIMYIVYTCISYGLFSKSLAVILISYEYKL